LSNFFTKTKDFKETIDVCMQQALYNNAMNVRKIYELRLYINLETIYDNNAYTIASTYYDDSKTLKLYITHYTLLINSNCDYEYRMT